MPPLPIQLENGHKNLPATQKEERVRGGKDGPHGGGGGGGGGGTPSKGYII